MEYGQFIWSRERVRAFYMAPRGGRAVYMEPRGGTGILYGAEKGYGHFIWNREGVRAVYMEPRGVRVVSGLHNTRLTKITIYI